MNHLNFTTRQVNGYKNLGYFSTEHSLQSTAPLIRLQTLSYWATGVIADIHIVLKK